MFFAVFDAVAGIVSKALRVVGSDTADSAELHAARGVIVKAELVFVADSVTVVQ